MGFKFTYDWFTRQQQAGLLSAGKPPPMPKTSKKKAGRQLSAGRQRKAANRKPAPVRGLLADSFQPPATWVIGLYTCSEANQSVHWRVKHKRKTLQKTIVAAVLSRYDDVLQPFREHYAAGGQLKIELCRIAPGKLDRTVNLPSSIKAVEDQLAKILKCNDGDDRWLCTVSQKTGSKVYGIRITLTRIQST